MFDDDIVSVLPRHSTEFERALEQASLWVIQNSEIVDVWNPETCPPRFLPWLAWSVSVDDWGASWTDGVRRRVIQKSVFSHRIKGTPGSILRALEARGYAADLQEWFNTTDDPHTFRLDAFSPAPLTDFGGSQQEALDELLRIVTATKPARSHMASLRIGYIKRQHLRLGQAGVVGVGLRGASNVQRTVISSYYLGRIGTAALGAVRYAGWARLERRPVRNSERYRVAVKATLAARFAGNAAAKRPPNSAFSITALASGGAAAVRVTGAALAKRYSQ